MSFKAGESASKNPKLFGEASASSPWQGLNSMQEAVRASVTPRGRQGQPDARRQAELGKHGHAPHFTQDDATGTRCSTRNLHPSEKPGFRFYLYMHSLKLHMAKMGSTHSPLTHAGWHRGISDHRLPNGLVAANTQLQLQPFYFLKFSLTAGPIHKAECSSFPVQKLWS